MTKPRPDSAELAQGMDRIYSRPGFLLRRCHQISVSIFMECCAESDLTPAQYGVLYAVSHNAPIDQIAVARMIGLDRSTVSNVIERLVAGGLILRETDPRDRRRRLLRITSLGAERLDGALALTDAARAELLKPLAPADRDQLIRLLRKLMMAHGERSRVPFDPNAHQRRCAATPERLNR